MSHPPANDIPQRHLRTAKECAQKYRITEQSWWNGVREGRFPAPVYPAARAPRWWEDEADAAVEATRARPADQMAARRAARIAASNAEAA